MKIILPLLQGSLVSLEVFFLTLIFSVPLGFLIASLRLSKIKVVSGVAQIFLLIIRGTPLMLQLLVVYFAPYYIFGRSFDRFLAAIIALVVNYGCYFAEIYRGGIQGIPVGQYEAAKVLGYSKSQTFFSIVLPQVVKKVIPPMGNEVINLVKDTALVQVIGVVELLRVSQTSASRVFSTTPIFIAGIFYLIMNALVTIAFKFLEKKLDYYR